MPIREVRGLRVLETAGRIGIVLLIYFMILVLLTGNVLITLTRWTSGESTSIIDLEYFPLVALLLTLVAVVVYPLGIFISIHLYGREYVLIENDSLIYCIRIHKWNVCKRRIPRKAVLGFDNKISTNLISLRVIGGAAIVLWKGRPEERSNALSELSTLLFGR